MPDRHASHDPLAWKRADAESAASTPGRDWCSWCGALTRPPTKACLSLAARLGGYRSDDPFRGRQRATRPLSPERARPESRCALRPLRTNCGCLRQRGTHACFPRKSERLRRQPTRRPQSRAAAWRARRTTLTRPRHTAPRVLPRACPAALPRSARGTPVVSDAILRVTSQTTDALRPSAVPAVDLQRLLTTPPLPLGPRTRSRRASAPPRLHAFQGGRFGRPWWGSRCPRGAGAVGCTGSRRTAGWRVPGEAS
jgi:hypothetical protein